MRLTALFESTAGDLKQAMGLRYFKRMQDPLRSYSAQKKLLPQRSGNQDTPLKPRHRRYFNAPIGAVQGKIGYGSPLGGDLMGGDAGPKRKGAKHSGYFQRKGKFDRP